MGQEGTLGVLERVMEVIGPDDGIFGVFTCDCVINRGNDGRTVLDLPRKHLVCTNERPESGGYFSRRGASGQCSNAMRLGLQTSRAPC